MSLAMALDKTAYVVVSCDRWVDAVTDAPQKLPRCPSVAPFGQHTLPSSALTRERRRRT
jgi:hypothetical protein